MTSITWKRSARCAGNGSCVEAASAAFSKSSASYIEGNCVEASGAEFRSASNMNGSCAEAGHGDGVIWVRDSKDAAGDFPHLHYPASEWDGGRAVEFTLVSRDLVPPRLLAVAVVRGLDAWQPWYRVTRDGEDTALWFTEAERDAWDAGVKAGEFELATAAA